MNHHKFNSNQNLKYSQQSGKIFKHSNSKKTARNSFKSRNVRTSQNRGFNLLNLVFVFASIFSVISFGLIFYPSFTASRVANAQTQKSQQSTIITNFNSKDFSTVRKGKSFLQPIEVVEVVKK